MECLGDYKSWGLWKEGRGTAGNIPKRTLPTSATSPASAHCGETKWAGDLRSVLVLRQMEEKIWIWSHRKHAAYVVMTPWEIPGKCVYNTYVPLMYLVISTEGENQNIEHYLIINLSNNSICPKKPRVYYSLGHGFSIYIHTLWPWRTKSFLSSTVYF